MLVRFYGTLRGESGVRQLEIEAPDGATVSSVLLAALDREPRLSAVLLEDAGRLRPDLLVLRNGRDIRLLQGIDTPLAEHDRLDLFPLTGAQRALAVD